MGVQAGMVLCKYDPCHEQLEVGEEVCQVLRQQNQADLLSSVPTIAEDQPSFHNVKMTY